MTSTAEIVRTKVAGHKYLDDIIKVPFEYRDGCLHRAGRARASASRSTKQKLEKYAYHDGPMPWHAPIREIAIIGAGNGGCAAAADLTLRGFEVRLYGRSASTIAPISERGSIELTGSLGEHVVPIAQVTNDAGEAMRGADLVILMGPTHAHARHGRDASRRISRDDQILLAAPGHTCC